MMEPLDIILLSSVYVMLAWFRRRQLMRRFRLRKLRSSSLQRLLSMRTSHLPRQRCCWKKRRYRVLYDVGVDFSQNLYSLLQIIYRVQSYWYDVVPHYSEYDWIENFRMKKERFYEITELVRNEMSPDSASVRPPIPLEMRVAIAIYKLGSCAEYRSVANLFGVGISTVQKFVKMFCTTICLKLPDFIHPPSDEEAKDIARRIEVKYGFTQVFGCIDGSHIEVTAPVNGKRDYQNRKGGESIVLQAVVHDNYCFWDINVTMPGSCHDAFIFTNSRLYESMNVLPRAPVQINNLEVPLLILGDPAYPLLPWLQKPYTGRNLAPAEESFNAYLSSVRIVVENAFGKLKERWCMIGKKLDARIDLAPQIIATCCVLQNICERSHTPISGWSSANYISSQMMPNLVQAHDLPSPSPQPPIASEVRRALTEHIATNLPLRRCLRPHL